MSEYTKMIIAVLIKNAVTVICFTILAIVFDKWWIVLFSVLCTNTLEWKRV